MRSLCFLAAVAIAVPAFVLACGKNKGAKLSPQECDGLRAAAESSAKAAASEVQSSESCFSVDSCMEMLHPSCVANCNGYGIPKTARQTVAKSFGAIEDGPCKQWKESDCANIAPMPVASCATYVPACKDHQCIMRNKLEVLSAAECESLLAAANKDVDAKLAAADRSCKVDDDCMLTKGGCVGGCGGPAIAKRGATAYVAEHASIDVACKRWWDGDCMTTTPQAVPSCAPIVARCKGGQCTAAVHLP